MGDGKMICPLRSGYKYTKYCDPANCMFGRCYEFDRDDGFLNRYWVCSMCDSSGSPNTLLVELSPEQRYQMELEAELDRREAEKKGGD